MLMKHIARKNGLGSGLSIDLFALASSGETTSGLWQVKKL